MLKKLLYFIANWMDGGWCAWNIGGKERKIRLESFTLLEQQFFLSLLRIDAHLVLVCFFFSQIFFFGFMDEAWSFVVKLEASLMREWVLYTNIWRSAFGFRVAITQLRDYLHGYQRLLSIICIRLINSVIVFVSSVSWFCLLFFLPRILQGQFRSFSHVFILGNLTFACK